MVIDTSALMAILLGEAEAERFAQSIAADPRRLVSTFTALEAGVVVLARKGAQGVQELDLLLESTAVSLVDLNARQMEIARSAYDRYGKGRHPAALNLGDCCSYALSQATGEPLLFKGNDFSRTDVEIVSVSSF